MASSINTVQLKFFNLIMLNRNEASQQEEHFNSSKDSLFNTLSKFESFRENDLATLLSPANMTYDTSQLIFTSTLTKKYFLTLKSHFPLLFSIRYPDSFFQSIYNNSYYTILGLDIATKELTSFAVIDIKSNIAEVLALGVIKEYQNKRVGSNLLTKVLEELVVFGVKRVKLIVNSNNQNAIKLYKRAGFIEIDEDVNYYRGLENCKGIYMIKTLVVERFWVFKVLRNFTKKLCF
jgi:ribosomal protein S18 acetylase RimI-like enzyme